MSVLRWSFSVEIALQCGLQVFYFISSCCFCAWLVHFSSARCGWRLEFNGAHYPLFCRWKHSVLVSRKISFHVFPYYYRISWWYQPVPAATVLAIQHGDPFNFPLSSPPIYLFGKYFSLLSAFPSSPLMNFQHLPLLKHYYCMTIRYIFTLIVSAVSVLLNKLSCMFCLLAGCVGWKELSHGSDTVHVHWYV